MRSRPAESSGVAAAVALLIAYVFGVRDAETVLALAVVIGAVPGAVTWLVERLRPPSRETVRAAVLEAKPRRR